MHFECLCSVFCVQHQFMNHSSHKKCMHLSHCLQIICTIKVLLFYMHLVSYWQLNKHHWFMILCIKFILYQGLLPYSYINLFPTIGLSHLFVINICIEDGFHMLLLGTQLRPWDFCLDFRIIFWQTTNI